MASAFARGSTVSSAIRFGVAVDHREQIVEVVRDAAGEKAHGLHLLRLTQLRLESPAIGDVLEHANQLRRRIRRTHDRNGRRP